MKSTYFFPRFTHGKAQEGEEDQEGLRQAEVCNEEEVQEEEVVLLYRKPSFRCGLFVAPAIHSTL